MSHDQNNSESVFSVDKDALQDNVQAKLLISQQLMILNCIVSPYHLYFIKAANLCFPSTKQIWKDKEKRR